MSVGDAYIKSARREARLFDVNQIHVASRASSWTVATRPQL